MESEKKSNGALVGLVIVLLILIIGGIYVWYSEYQSLMKIPEEGQPVGAQSPAR